MIFSKKSLRLACAVLGAALLGTAFAGCGSKESGDTIKVGANFELTGNVANYGSATFEGLQLAIDEANEAGGVNGKKIELVSVDDKSEAAESINAATKLISDDNVKVIVGPATTGLVLAETQTATDAKVPIIAPCATSPEATVENGKVKPYVFRSCFIDPQQGAVMATFAAQELKAKTAVIYVDNSSDYSKNLGKVFKEKFEAAGGKVVMEEAFLQKDQDFKATLTKHYSEKDAEVQGFIEAYKKKYNRAPNVFAALGYDAGKMLVDALKRAGSDDTEKIREALEATKDLKVGTGTISMDTNHNPIKTAVILEMKNGEKELKAKITPEGN